MNGRFFSKAGKKKAFGRPLRQRLVSVLCFLAVLAVFFFVPVPSFVAKKAEGQMTLGFMMLCNFMVPCPVIDTTAILLEAKLAGFEDMKFLEQVAKYGNIISGFASVFDLYDSFADKENKGEKSNTAMDLAAKEAQVKVAIETAQVELDADVQNSELKNRMAIAADQAPQNPAEQFLCNKILTCQGVLVTREFAQRMSRVIGEGLAMMYRGPDQDGNGPAYANLEEELRTGTNAPFDKMKTASSKDGYPKGSLAPEMGPNIGMDDADIVYRTLEGGGALTVPPMKQETIKTKAGTVTVNVPNPSKDDTSQWLWVAALRYCYQVAGPRPTPPYGDELDDPKLAAKKEKWNQCAVMQNSFIKVCTDRLASLSRPDCSDSGMDKYCEETKKACNAGRRAYNVNVSSLGGCSNGMSLNQAEELCNSTCGASRRFQADKNTGGSDAVALADLGLCGIVKNMWRRKAEEEKEAFVEGVASMEKLRGCWAAAQ